MMRVDGETATVSEKLVGEGFGLPVYVSGSKAIPLLKDSFYLYFFFYSSMYCKVNRTTAAAADGGGGVCARVCVVGRGGTGKEFAEIFTSQGLKISDVLILKYSNYDIGAI